MSQSVIDIQLVEASHRHRPLLREVPTIAADRARRPGVAIQLGDLRKSFGGRDVLRGVSLDIKEGEFIAIVGHSGCGKSTLLRLLAGLDTPTDGRIAMDREPVGGRVAAARLLFQDARLLPWRRVLDNVGIGLSGDWREAAMEKLRAVGLDDRYHDWPAVLSGGQRQRVALARALVSQPKLLLLDEPLGALDALTRLDMQALIEMAWLKQKCTAVLVTHDVAEAVALADRVIVLDKGVVSLEIAVTAERPRPRRNAELAALEAQLLDRLLHRELAGIRKTLHAAVGG
jgi:sulfonate transport system ATP-binding protein